MRLRIQLPEVRPDEYAVPLTCPYECSGRHFVLHQRRRKAVCDPTYHEVIVRRYKCLRCGRSFRVHPTGITADHRSQRLRGIGVMLYVMGLSYGGVADVLAAMGWSGSKSSVYRDVQAAGEGVERFRRRQPTRRVRVADALRPLLTRLQAEFGIEAILTDDQDSYKLLSDELALAHGICRTHVNRNVAKLVGQLSEQLLCLPDGPLPEIRRTVSEVLDDLQYMQQLMALRPADGLQQLDQLLRTYQAAAPPAKGTKASIAYRIRIALLRWSNHWTRLTFDLRWNRRESHRLDGTNSVAERAIGTWIKERYRTMRTYKRLASVRNLSRLIPCLAAHQDHPVLTTLLAD